MRWVVISTEWIPLADPLLYFFPFSSLSLSVCSIFCVNGLCYCFFPVFFPSSFHWWTRSILLSILIIEDEERIRNIPEFWPFPVKGKKPIWDFFSSLINSPHWSLFRTIVSGKKKDTQKQGDKKELTDTEKKWSKCKFVFDLSSALL